MLSKEILSLARKIISRQEESGAVASGWQIFKIHGPQTIEVVATVDCAGSRFQVPLLVNLKTGEVHEIN